ncbi:FMN reductase [Lysobacter korlensis]|uniref:FMN reductase n=1 Tax=Lysobacter korlensis TaxID=553636 RepID=A0ABV6S235_9GAMM
MTAKKLTVVSAGLGQPSSTRLLADRLASATVAQLNAHGTDVEVDVIDLRDLAHDITNSLLTGFPSQKLDAAIAAVSTADGLIAVTPVFNAGYSGLFKSFADLFDPKMLRDLPVLVAATGGSERHSLVLDHGMRPLFTYLHAVVVPTGVYAASSDWGSGASSGQSALPDRISRAARELAALVAASDRSARPLDPFVLDPSFSPIGAFSAE